MNNNRLDLGSLILQLISLDVLFKDFNNTDLMQELQTQDEKYLKKIKRRVTGFESWKTSVMWKVIINTCSENLLAVTSEKP